MPDSIRVIRDGATPVEARLREMGGMGHGMGQLAKSLEGQLPEHVLRDILRMNGLRNKVMHDGHEPTAFEVRRYEEQAARVLGQLGGPSAYNPRLDPEVMALYERATRPDPGISLRMKVVMTIITSGAIMLISLKPEDLSRPQLVMLIVGVLTVAVLLIRFGLGPRQD